MRGACERFQDQGKERFRSSRRNRYLFQEHAIICEKFEGVLPRRFNFFQILFNFGGGRERFRQRPFKGIIPEARADAAEGLLDGGGAAKEMLAA